MPLYDYFCKKCNYSFEELRHIDERFFVECPKCNNNKAELCISCKPPADHTFQPFWHEDFGDKPILVTSREHYRELCKKHGVYAPHVFGQGWNLGEV